MHVDLNYELTIGFQTINFLMVNPLKIKSHFNLRVIKLQNRKKNPKNP